MTPTPATFGEPWSLTTDFEGLFGIIAKTQEGQQPEHFVCVITEPRYTKTEQDVANGNRIITCVNALAGIPDPAAFREAVRELATAASGVLKTSRTAEDWWRLKEALSRLESQIQKQEGQQ